jgi:hypothetical protein
MRGPARGQSRPPALAKNRGANTALRPLVEQKSLCDSLSRHNTEAEPAHLASSRQPRVQPPGTVNCRMPVISRLRHDTPRSSATLPGERRKPHAWIAIDDDADGWDVRDAAHLAQMPPATGLIDIGAQMLLQDRLAVQFSR